MVKSPNSAEDSVVPVAVSQPAPAEAPGKAPQPEDSKVTPSVTEEHVEDEEEGLPEADRDAAFLLFAAVPSWLVSLVLHLIIILVLALWYLPHIPVFRNDLTIGHPDVVETDLTNLEENATELSLDTETSQMTITDAPEITTDNPALVDDPLDTEAQPMEVELSAIGFEATDSTDLLQELGSFTGSGLEGRSAAERTRLIREAGGTPGSEQAVKRALQWLKRHQNPDGSWSFYHLAGRCPCPGHGSMAQARIGATAMALLPFLGAGNTHMSGNYKAEIQRGLYFLLNMQKANGSLWEEGGNMYSHGLASIVLCEAYAMTGDKALHKPAQASLNFIAYAQDPITRGWRYRPRDMSGGDTSVVGWMLMALKSGHMANLQVSGTTVSGTKKFLNSVQANNGATYGYMAPGQKNSTTAIGLLCRMYLGWGHSHDALAEGVRRLSRAGPSKVDMYYNYYATQVMRHYEGEHWEKWNKKMRDYLVKTQNRSGHADGSWHMGRQHTDKGGRLYCTAMATMILEVYYRHMPIYGKKASQDEFEL